MKKDLRIAMLFTLIAIFTSVFLVQYQFESMQQVLPVEEFDIDHLPLPYIAIVAIAAAQLGIMVFVLSWIGLRLARITNLKLPILDALFDKKAIYYSKSWLIASLLLGVLGGFTIISSDKFIFSRYIPLLAENPPTFSLNGLLVGVLYGGIIEEVLIRLFLMTFLVWILYKLVGKKRTMIPDYMYWMAIVIAAIVFVVGHFPATIFMFGELNTIIVIRGFFLNGLFGLFFGYLYWRQGIEYAMISHMTAHISMQLLFIPIFY